MIAALVLTELSSALDAPRAVQMKLLDTVVALAGGIPHVGTVPTTRRAWAADRTGRTPGARPQA